MHINAYETCQMIMIRPKCMWINTRGVTPSSLIILESNGLDIILGMDWLVKYRGVTGCATKSIQLTHPNGQTVEYQSNIEVSDSIQLNQA